MKKIILAFCLLILVVSCKQVKQPTIEPTPGVTYNYSYSEQEIELANMINHYRDSIKYVIKNNDTIFLKKLELNNFTSIKCEGHNKYMITTKIVNHDYFQSRSDSIIAIAGADRVGENIAYNYVTSKSAFRAWLKSDGHRKNMEGDYTNFGISIRTDSVTKRRYYTNIFFRKKQ
jgi:uncharacterized protein YkwD